MCGVSTFLSAVNEDSNMTLEKPCQFTELQDLTEEHNGRFDWVVRENTNYMFGEKSTK